MRAELREIGIEAMGMESAEEAGQLSASGQIPAAIILGATARLCEDPRMASLIARVPTVLIASQAEKLELPPAAAVLYRPVRIADIVARVTELTRKGHAA